jgi:hypothetical protein
MQWEERLQAFALKEILLLQFDISESGLSAWWERFDAMLHAMSEVRRRSRVVRGLVSAGDGVERAALEVEVEGNCLDMETRAGCDFGIWGRQLEAQCARAGASPCFGSRTCVRTGGVVGVGGMGHEEGGADKG